MLTDMMRDIYVECLAVLDRSTLSPEDRALWASTLMRNPTVVHAYFVRVFGDTPELLPDATVALRLTMHAGDGPEMLAALVAHEREMLARG